MSLFDGFWRQLTGYDAKLEKETIDSYNTGESRGREVSHSLNYQKLGHELLSRDEFQAMDGGKCILQLRGVRPFFSDKYDLTKHPNYKELAEENPGNTFDIGLLKGVETDCELLKRQISILMEQLFLFKEQIK